MPNYKVPAEDYGDEVISAAKKKKEQPTVYVPIDPKWITKMKVGQMVTIKVSGKVQSLDMHDGEKRKHSETRIAVDSVSYYPETQASKYFEETENDEDD